MAIRYPKDGEDLGARLETHKPLKVGEWELLSKGEDVVFFAIGRMVQAAMNACIELMHHGVRAGVVDARFVKPMDEALLRASLNAPLWVTVEENVISGGLGERILAWLAERTRRGTGQWTLAYPTATLSTLRSQASCTTAAWTCRGWPARCSRGWGDEKAPR